MAVSFSRSISNPSANQEKMLFGAIRSARNFLVTLLVELTLDQIAANENKKYISVLFVCLLFW